MENEQKAEFAVGPNPNYRKPKAVWHTVEIVAAEGTEFGLVEELGGTLTVIARRQGEDWPHGMEPKSGVNVIAKGCRVYCVQTDEREEPSGPPVSNAMQD